MEAPNAMFSLADATGLLSSFCSPSVHHRMSLYADDLVVFVAPVKHDIRDVRAILDIFAGASGLHTNIGKCQFTPICCGPEHLDIMERLFPWQLAHFPCKYLGVPLSIYKLNKADLQTLIDSVADCLPTWKAGLMSRAGRTSLVKSTLSAIAIHTFIVVHVSLAVYRAINKLMRAFIWPGSDTVQGGRCLVAWSKVTRPSELGGLGVVDLTTLGYTLRLRWEWLARTEAQRLWTPLPLRTENIVKAMLQIYVSVQVGDGGKALFWSDRWLGGSCVADLAPLVVAAVRPHVRKRLLIMEGLQDDQWILDIVGSLSVPALAQYIAFWDCVQHIHLNNEPDRFIWKWITNQQYSASSAYRAFFHGQCGIAGAKELSKVRAPLPAKSSYGHRFLVVRGLRRDCNATTCPTTEPALYVPKLRNRCSTCF
jgi:hypothetical protein